MEFIDNHAALVLGVGLFVASFLILAAIWLIHLSDMQHKEYREKKQKEHKSYLAKWFRRPLSTDEANRLNLARWVAPEALRNGGLAVSIGKWEYEVTGNPGRRRGDMNAQSKVGQYISCQTCHKPAGDHQTKDSGTCYDCAQAIIAAGHKREAEAEERTRIGNTPTCDECGEQHNEERECGEVA